MLPVDFLTSPNLDKLRQEQSQITPSPQNAFPLSLHDGDRTWKIEAVGLDPALHEPDLGVVYQSTGVTDPAALRTEATAVMSAFLKGTAGDQGEFSWAVGLCGEGWKAESGDGIADEANTVDTGAKGRRD